MTIPRSSPARGAERSRGPAGLGQLRAALTASAREQWGVLGFLCRLLWAASPVLTVLFVLLSCVSGIPPLLRVRATQYLISGLMPWARGGQERAHGSLGTAGLALLALIGAMVLDNLLEAAAPLLAVHFGERLTEQLGLRIHARATSIDLSSYENHGFQNLADAARRATGEQLVSKLKAFRQLVSSLIGMLTVAFVFAPLHPAAPVLLLVGSAPFVVLCTRQTSELISLTFDQTPLRRKLSYWRDLSTLRESAAELRLFGLGEYYSRNWRTLSDRLIAELFAVRRRHGFRRLRIILADSLVTGAVIALIIHAAVTRSIGGGLVVASLYALRQYLTLRDGLPAQITETIQGFFQISLTRSFLMEDVEPRPPAGERADAAPKEPVIEFEGVGFTYPGAKSPSLSDINLTIRPGEHLALVGANGAGKTTLALLLLGLYPPTKGRILIDGIDLRNIDAEEWWSQSGAIMQNFVRYQLTARENIGFGQVDSLADLPAVRDAARMSDADALITGLPDGYETLLGRGFSGAHDLSLGQWQKIALARAYLRRAPVLVLDEPTAALDPMMERQVCRQFTEVSAGRTAVLISHRLSSARDADLIVFLDRGRILEVGTHRELMSAEGSYAELFELQARGYRTGDPVGGAVA